MKRNVLNVGLAAAVALSGLVVAGGNASAKDKDKAGTAPSVEGCRNIEGGTATYARMVDRDESEGRNSAESFEQMLYEELLLEGGHEHQVEYAFQNRGVVDVSIIVDADASCSTVEYIAILYRIQGTGANRTYIEYQRISTFGDDEGGEKVGLPLGAVATAAGDSHQCVAVRVLTREAGWDVDYAPDIEGYVDSPAGPQSPTEVCTDSGGAGTGWK